ncbi:MAG: hypothetical protein QM704_14030 [Anaeromyxobacteraceae bacterium]
MLALLLGAVLAAPAAGQEEGPASPVHDLGWRGSRWGMKVEDVVAAFPGEAVRLDPALRLADGNEVAVELPGHRLAGEPLRARFVFTHGRLVLVSLRTPEDHHAAPAAYAAVRAALASTFGFRGAESRDDSLVDLRQTRWVLGQTAVDLRYIPGVVSVVWFPWPPPAEIQAQPEAGEAAR